jgi:hypothetical protein
VAEDQSSRKGKKLTRINTGYSAMIICLILSGCATPQVITASETAISVEIKNTGITASEMIKKGAALAEEHCRKFGRKANLENTSGFWGAAHIANFKCS